jgi:hypothetical protein
LPLCGASTSTSATLCLENALDVPAFFWAKNPLTRQWSRH